MKSTHARHLPRMRARAIGVGRARRAPVAKAEESQGEAPVGTMATNVFAGVGAGRDRDYWGIRRELSARGLSMADVGRMADVGPTTTRETCQGIANNRKVLRTLLEMGLPKEMVSPPKDMSAAHTTTKTRTRHRQSDAMDGNAA